MIIKKLTCNYSKTVIIENNSKIAVFLFIERTKMFTS